MGPAVGRHKRTASPDTPNFAPLSLDLGSESSKGTGGLNADASITATSGTGVQVGSMLVGQVSVAAPDRCKRYLGSLVSCALAGLARNGTNPQRACGAIESQGRPAQSLILSPLLRIVCVDRRRETRASQVHSLLRWHLAWRRLTGLMQYVAVAVACIASRHVRLEQTYRGAGATRKTLNSSSTAAQLLTKHTWAARTVCVGSQPKD
ncbi:uncharacterized protein LY79DRAFT_577359 [Colletotrichum navitas]|uniref:Uncharacterized protein n=1 Tax=Colletotrichum navitas TaxID=681940 RepID=A0AAD8Q624_9PEZI|nr:uncharacterized protein LY79DRAFT_577359 [Colletotrichum navitas]KAK1596319.1 hypothetical protein LY79DRAFT_577359 [Colletotrichum navitas]